MKTERIFIDGLGGQGVLLSGKLLGQAAINHGLYATFQPSYGAEVRGGTAHCDVVIAPDPVKSPFIEIPTVTLLYCQQSFDRFANSIPGGVILANTSLINADNYQGQAELIPVPASRIADSLSVPNAVNMAMLGALLGITHLLPLDAMESGMQTAFSARHHKSIPLNLQAMQQGMDAVQNYSITT
ncbi:MAG: 2-oxoacid:acceptor oxidoreductase family protein [Planctomycetes bacterium]|nr:2-oxoacid:acceptor oxidoreductase family protein [Planctomycetota bacterium]